MDEPIAWIKARELTYMKAVVEHGATEWKTNLGLKPEDGDVPLYTAPPQQPEPEQEIDPDRPHVEDDGCPTEKAVLQRFWREHQKQEPVACPYCHYSHTLGAVFFDQNCAGCVNRMTTPPQREWMERERAVGYREGHQAALKQREWQTLTENEIKHLWYEACQTNLELTSQLIVHLARNIEAKLKKKNT